MSAPIVPFRALYEPDSEPYAVLRFGDIEVRLSLTYLHHLRNCEGWGDRHPNNSMFGSDLIMRDAMESIEREMWKAIDLQKKGA